ncbi:hypothetical protein J2S08_002488 [Bacillus chungangensis]|uniref:Uncharacterized protein n=1 Tax=Bacillus chungangensis TaxID=587633 RepID=A0ABT9WTS5_9BACI|nr:hypothetical protein [Bacillus chungangensis]MDQ0176630.1 hypothetical protein [Bacillus chungangensis]
MALIYFALSLYCDIQHRTYFITHDGIRQQQNCKVPTASIGGRNLLAAQFVHGDIQSLGNFQGIENHTGLAFFDALQRPERNPADLGKLDKAHLPHLLSGRTFTTGYTPFFP